MAALLVVCALAHCLAIASDNSVIRLNMGPQELHTYLDFYAMVAHKTPVIASNVPVSRMVTLNDFETDRSTGLGLMRSQLLRYGIVVSDVSETQFSVTFNDKLNSPPSTPEKERAHKK